MNDFDPASFQLSPEQLAAVQQRQLEREREHAASARSGRKSRMYKVRDKRLPGIDSAFVMVPWPYILEAGAALNSSVAVLMLLGILYEVWRQKSNIVTLPTAAFEAAGIHRSARTRGWNRLLTAGLIKMVERKRGSRPLIELLWHGPQT